MTKKIRPSSYLYDFIKKKVDLADFLETEIGCTLNWLDQNISAVTCCPIHKESKPSFRINYVEEDGLWIYHCFGCGIKGTIIDFFIDYYGIPNSAEAVISICERFGFKDTAELAISSLRDTQKRSNFKKKIELTHIVTSNQCRMLLRSNFKRYNKWVAEAYKRMNEALLVEDMATIEKVGSEASFKMGE